MQERIKSGDEAAEEEFARYYHPRLLAMARVRLRDEELAWDLAQEATIAALEAVRKGLVREADKLSAFVHGVGRNVINNFLRRKSTQPQLEPLHDDAVVAMPDGSEAARLSVVTGEIERLDPIDRRILRMTLIDGAKPGEIAAALGLDGNVVRQRKLRATRRIAEKLSQSDRRKPPVR